MDLGLKGKRVLISGSTSGLGLATATQLLKEKAEVCLNRRITKKLEIVLSNLRKSQYAFGFAADVTRKEECKSLILHAVDKMRGLTKSLLKELGQYKIRVNSILPGWTYTQRVANLINKRVKRNNSTAEEEISGITDKIPLSRMASPEEFGKVAAFLTSTAASFVTGGT